MHWVASYIAIHADSEDAEEDRNMVGQRLHVHIVEFFPLIHLLGYTILQDEGVRTSYNFIISSPTGIFQSFVH